MTKFNPTLVLDPELMKLAHARDRSVEALEKNGLVITSIGSIQPKTQLIHEVHLRGERITAVVQVYPDINTVTTIINEHL
jgi:hypothetical protein